MADPIRAALERLVAADSCVKQAGPEYAQAREAARAALAAAPEATPMTDKKQVLTRARALARALAHDITHIPDASGMSAQSQNG
jgi:hypothetical protein